MGDSLRLCFRTLFAYNLSQTIFGISKHKSNLVLVHTKARNIIGRVIRVLKIRFKCLQAVLTYTTQKVAIIISVHCALHNIICRLYNSDVVMEELYDENIQKEPD